MSHTPSACPRVPITDPKGWLESNIALVTHVVTGVARRRRLRPQDGDDLLSIVCTHLLKDDGRVLRQYRGTSSVATYLTVVVERQVLDMRTAEWGKWRPSAEARRQGPEAIRFERLVARDGMDPQQARLMTGSMTRSPLDRTALPARRRRHFVGVELAAHEASRAADPHEHVVQARHAVAGVTVRRHLAAALRDVPASDRLILRLHYGQGLRVAQIARRLQLDQRALYSRLTALHRRLRALLTAAGLGAPDVVGLTGGPVCHVRPLLWGPHAEQ